MEKGINLVEEDDIEELDLSLAESQNSIFLPDEEEAYTKVKVLGRGAFGEAVLYRKTTTNELLVWKEINLERANDNERNNALNEIEILSQLDHINVVAYYNDFFDGSSLFIEMEYANDGTLHHKIISRDGKLFDEEEVLCYFYQLMSAISYIHKFGILHRDIKTLNIFMNKNKIVKVGDFGISKILEETYGNAQTCVGTPYYMSPELVKGESYNQKSDIWACGCVLYELLTLSKVFDGSNQLKLIMAILEKDYAAIDENYSDDIKDIVNKTLQKEASNRPCATDIVKLAVFDKAKQFVSSITKSTTPLKRMTSQSSLLMSQRSSTIVSTQLTSDVFFWGGGKKIPQKSESFSEGNSGLHVSAGFSHFAVVTIEKELYTWANIQGGMEIVGQLGHGNTAMYRIPKKVTFFEGVPVKQVCCGEDFTVILTENFEVYACGSDYYGCIGCDNEHGDNVLLPVKIEALNEIQIQSIACGDSHVVALSFEGQVYTWGCGEMGRLGLGDEDDRSLPELVTLPERFSTIVSIACGRDNTFILTSNGQLLAFGSNENNKMALNQLIRFKSNEPREGDIVHYVLTPTPVRSMRSYHITNISSGKTHSAVIDKFGRVITFGSNNYGQLGVGNYNPRVGPALVRGLLTGKEVIHISCGNGFTVAATKNNLLFSWGRAENGRLGVELNGKKSFASPKTIFGSLHRVASLSSRHWNTIILAEQVTSSKVIRTKSLSVTEGSKLDSRNELTSDFDSSASFQFNMDLNEELGNIESNTENNKNITNNCNNSGVQPWLVNQWDDTEFIPMQKTCGNNESNEDKHDDEVPTWLADQWDKEEYIPIKENNDGEAEDTDDAVFDNPRARQPSVRETFRSVRESLKSGEMCSKCLSSAPNHLEIKIQELEIENLKLNKIIKEQEILISTLKRERDTYKKCANKLFELGTNTIS